jgi:WXG100 family type VII secretion target
MAGAGSGFKVDTDVLSKNAQAIGPLVQQFQGKLTTLDGDMNQMFKGWQGQASAAFVKLHSNWQSHYDELNKNLNTIGHNLDANSKTYLSADQSSTPTG